MTQTPKRLSEEELRKIEDYARKALIDKSSSPIWALLDHIRASSNEKGGGREFLSFSGSRWRRLRSAPKDGTMILLGVRYHGATLVTQAWWSDEHECWHDWYGDVGDCEPTHWQPLEECPELGDPADDELEKTTNPSSSSTPQPIPPAPGGDWDATEIAECIAELEKHEPCRAPFHSTLEGKAARIIQSLSDTAGRLTKERDKEEQLHEQTIDERDSAEECINDIYFMMTGRSPEWTGSTVPAGGFGYQDALDELTVMKQALANEHRNLQSQLTTAQSQIADLKKQLEEKQGVIELEEARRIYDEIVYHYGTKDATLYAYAARNLKTLSDAVVRLQSELAALKKPVEEGEIADKIKWLEAQVRYNVPADQEFTQGLKYACEDMLPFLRRLSADKARMEEALRTYQDATKHLRDLANASAVLMLGLAPTSAPQLALQAANKFLDDVNARAALPKQKATS